MSKPHYGGAIYQPLIGLPPRYWGYFTVISYPTRMNPAMLSMQHGASPPLNPTRCNPWVDYEVEA